MGKKFEKFNEFIKQDFNVVEDYKREITVEEVMKKLEVFPKDTTVFVSVKDGDTYYPFKIISIDKEHVHPKVEIVVTNKL